MRYAWFLFATPLLGQYLPNNQFSDLTTTRDGNILYFSSPLNLRGDTEQPYQKIFRIDSAGIRPIVQIERTGPTDLPNFSNFYLAIEPDLSADGAVFSYVASRTCVGGSACVFFERYVSHVLAGGTETVYSGRTRLSRDGRYALRYDSTGIIVPSDPVPALIDLSTGTRTAVPGQILEGRPLASGGTVLVLLNTTPALWSPKGTTTLSYKTNLGRSVLSDNAAVIAVESNLFYGEPFTLFLYDVASGTSTVLDQSSTSGYDASISDDGRLVCYLRNSQVVLYDRKLQAEVPLPVTPDGVNEAVVSGDGSTIWVATAGGRMVRLDVASGSAQEVIPRTPLITNIFGAAVPGSLNWLYGSGLSSASSTLPFPLPEFVLEPNDWESVLLGSTRGRLANVTPNQILYQISFGIPPGTWEVSLYPNDSPFTQPALSINVVPFSPQPAILPPTDDAVVAHSDFSALVTGQNPAHPSEVVHVYFTGLGPVSPPLSSGVPAPLDRLEISQSPNCFDFSELPYPILFAGMAPGFAGVYQVDLQLPSQVSDIDPDTGVGSAYIRCSDNIAGEYDFSVFMAPVHN
ncbi:MAG TPA: hypothetical protein VLY24_04760 [Bryobacteraceae bacterium]|nr:hypothetical protein [Bryobacteraceae bacterium]